MDFFYKHLPRHVHDQGQGLGEWNIFNVEIDETRNMKRRILYEGLAYIRSHLAPCLSTSILAIFRCALDSAVRFTVFLWATHGKMLMPMTSS